MPLATSETLRKEAGITARQLDYWIRQNWIRPASQRHPGSGNVRRFSQDETKRVCLMASLVAAGIAPPEAHHLTMRGEYDANGVFRACIAGHVYVEVFP